MLDVLLHAEVYGLDPRDYRLDVPSTSVADVLSGKADTATRQRFDAALSRAALRFIRHLHSGRIDPRTAGFALPTSNTKFDADAALQRLASSPDVAKTVASFEPSPIPYRRLKAALATYRSLAQKPELTRLPPLPTRSIASGDVYRGAHQLRQLLIALGDLSPVHADDAADVIDPVLVEGVQRFQQRHGLETDGVIGTRTFAALTTPLEQRLRQIELSMERWRWLTATERPHIVVNIPQFMLFALPRAGQTDEVMEMRVIVGETYPHTRTPVFTSHLTQVVFQPFWDVPRGILLRELLPRIRADRSYLDRHDMEIVRGGGDDARVMAPTAQVIDALEAGELRLRQRPGPRNALGPVKFIMPNPYNVYLHATPENALFERSQRTFSHGCIRVSRPADLAEYVLKDAKGTWDTTAIAAALSGTRTFRVPLEKQVYVVIFYTTAVVTRSAGVLFFADVYGHDRKLEELLRKAHR